MLKAAIRVERVRISTPNGGNKLVTAPVAYGPDSEILHVWARPSDGTPPKLLDETVTIDGTTYQLRFL